MVGHQHPCIAHFFVHLQRLHKIHIAFVRENFHEIVAVPADVMQDEMLSQYAIGYTPLNDNKDGTYRKLEIKMSNKDLKAQARKGYYAIKPERGN